MPLKRTIQTLRQKNRQGITELNRNEYSFNRQNSLLELKRNIKQKTKDSKHIMGIIRITYNQDSSHECGYNSRKQSEKDRENIYSKGMREKKTMHRCFVNLVIIVNAIPRE